jgi:uncharacterized membrane protein
MLALKLNNSYYISMLPQYKMVFINLILSGLLSIGLIIYKYVFKRKINLFYLLILISLLPIISIFRSGSYESGDMTTNAIKTIAYYDSFAEGNIIPAWAGELNAGYGYPMFIFAYPLPYYITTLFHVLGFSFVNCVKLFLAFSYVLSGITMYLFLREEINKKSAIIGSIFYLFAPYHLVDMHFRVAIGEMLAFAILPLTFLFTKKIITQTGKQWLILNSLSLSLLIMSHQAISLVSFLFLALYAIFLPSKSIKRKLVAFLSFITGLLLSCFYWLPVLFEGKFTFQDLNAAINFPPLQSFIYSPWRYGFLFQGHMGELSHIIGYPQIIIIILSIVFLFIKQIGGKNKMLFRFSIFSFVVLFLMMQSISKPIWENIPLLINFQFSYRLLLIVSFFTSIIAGLIIGRINNKYLVIIICFITIMYTILNWGNRRTIPEINDQHLKTILPISTSKIEGLTPAVSKWVNPQNPWMTKIPKNHLEILRGEADYTEIYRNSTVHEYIINAKTDLYLRENTQYFPGWIISANKKQIPINYTNQEFPGIISFQLPRGLYYIELKFVSLPIVVFAKWLSGISFIVIIFYALISKKLNFPKF